LILHPSKATHQLREERKTPAREVTNTASELTNAAKAVSDSSFILYPSSLLLILQPSSFILRKTMFLDADINGSALPFGTICLTYDDGPGETAGCGPGPRTSELGAYLAEWRVPATFFVVGKFAGSLDHVLGQLKAQGHLVANHTFNHPHLVRDVRDQEKLVDQLL